MLPTTLTVLLCLLTADILPADGSSSVFRRRDAACDAARQHAASVTVPLQFLFLPLAGQKSVPPECSQRFPRNFSKAADTLMLHLCSSPRLGHVRFHLRPQRRLHPRSDRHLPVPHLSGQVRGISLYNAKRGHQIFWWPRALLMNGILLMSLCGSAFKVPSFCCC